MKVKYLKYIPLQKLVELGLNPTQVLLTTIIISFNKDDKSLRAGLDNISEALGLSGKTVARAIPKLVELKLISVKSGYKQRNANEYLPTAKLKDLYGQNDHINKASYGQNDHIDMDKMTIHTPKGYVIPKIDTDALARRYNFGKEHEDYKANFGPEYAKQMLVYRLTPERDRGSRRCPSLPPNR